MWFGVRMVFAQCSQNHLLGVRKIDLKQKTMKAYKTSINCNRVGVCSITLVLDKRTNKETDEYPMAICFTINRKRYYYKLTDMPFKLKSILTTYAASPVHEVRPWMNLRNGRKFLKAIATRF